jgi:hypothetical protein
MIKVFGWIAAFALSVILVGASVFATHPLHYVVALAAAVCAFACFVRALTTLAHVFNNSGGL